MRRGEGKKEREKETPRAACPSAPAPALGPPRFSLSLSPSWHRRFASG